MPWYQVMFVYQNLPVVEVDWQGIEIIPGLDVGTTTAWSWMCSGRGRFDSGLAIQRALLFEPSTISRHQHWVHLLEAMVTRPDQDVGVAAAGRGRRQVLAEWNQTRTDTTDLCLLVVRAAGG